MVFIIMQGADGSSCFFCFFFKHYPDQVSKAEEKCQELTCKDTYYGFLSQDELLGRLW